MAEPLAILGAVAAVSQVTGELVKLTTHLRHYLKIVRSAPEEVQAFVMETSNFTGLLNFFTELAESPVKDSGRREQRKRERRIEMVQNQCTYVCDKMEYLVDRFAGLARGNLTPLESLVERIKYLLDKPDIKDLRLSVQSATITINTMSTLFLWEEAKNDTRRISLLEQLKNLLPMGKKASADLAAHQQRHGIKYELEMPNPNNAILAASRVIQRQVSHIIKLQSRFEADVNEGWGQNPSDSSEQTSLSRPWSSPPGSGGIALDSPRHVPQQNANRVSSTQYGASHMSDDGAGASQRGVIIEPLNPRGSRSPEVEISSPPADGADNQAKWVPSRTSSEDSVSSLPTGENYTGWKGFLMSYYGIQTKPTELNPPGHEPQSNKSQLGHWVFESSYSGEPHLRECKSCSFERCTKCHEEHCIRDFCLKEGTVPVENKILKSNVQGDPLPLSEPRRAISNERSNREGIRSSYEEQTHDSSSTINNEEVSDLSDAEIDSAMGRWSRTDLALPSSKSSRPSTESPRSADSKEGNPAIVRAAETEIQVAPDLVKEVSKVHEERPRLQTEQEQSQHLSSAPKKQVREVQDTEVKEERRRRSESAPYKLVPVTRFVGPGGRRRPRRPHLRLYSD